MLKRTSLISAAILLVGTTAAPALAQDFSFEPAPGSSTLAGLLELEQSQEINCQTNVEVSINSSGDATVTSRTFSPGTPFLCGGIVNPAGTWTVVPIALDMVRLTVGASSILGSCSGTVDVDWDNSAGELDFDNVIIPGTPDDCRIDGILESSDDQLVIVEN